uniref:Transposase n=1 Tax=Panagrellus redivivus TaxID=6233 RepID=A0A7E4ZZQ4_PANRE
MWSIAKAEDGYGSAFEGRNGNAVAELQVEQARRTVTTLVLSTQAAGHPLVRDLQNPASAYGLKILMSIENQP